MSEMETYLIIDNPIFATLFSIVLTIGAAVYLLIIIIHFRVKRFLVEYYSLILGSIICEFCMTIIYLINSLFPLLVGSKELPKNKKVDMFCIVNSFSVMLVYFILVGYNSSIAISAIFGFFEKVKTNTYPFKVIHFISILFGFCMVNLLYWNDLLGYSASGFFGIKYILPDDTKRYKLIYSTISIFYCFLSIIYVICNIKNNYYKYSIVLKNYEWYVFGSSFLIIITLIFNLLPYFNLKLLDICFNIVCFIYILYYRVNQKYIKDIFKNRERNRLVYSILICCCIEDIDESSENDRLSISAYKMIN